MTTMTTTEKINEELAGVISSIERKENDIIVLKKQIEKQLTEATDINLILHRMEFLNNDSCSTSIPRVHEYCNELKEMYNKKQMLEYLLKA